MEAPKGPTNPPEIRLLGDLRVIRDGRTVALPASKRSRALLGYLIASGAPQTRQALCDLLWDGPDDPRAELRWSLSKLRPVVDDASATRINADREHVSFAPHGAAIDIYELRQVLAGDLARARVSDLERAAAGLQGEFLDGLDLPACYRFYQWCMAQREGYGRQRVALLSALIDRFKGEPERALPYARARVAADPLSEGSHADLIRLLTLLGRHRDAESHYRQTELMFQRELGNTPAGELREAVRQVRRLEARYESRANAFGTKAPVSSNTVFEPPRGFKDVLVGRGKEQRMIEATIGALQNPDQHPLLVFTGEPGMGKTRLLQVLADQGSRAGYRTLRARCYEAEMMRPYGVWIDALRDLPITLVPELLRHDLAPLLSASNQDSAAASDRSRMFAACSELMTSLSHDSPLILILDDLQWLDEGAASLLHYVTRNVTSTARLLIAGAARQGEIADNPWAKALFGSLTRNQHLSEYPLAPLHQAEVAELLRHGASQASPAEVHRLSGGNPLFAVALAQEDLKEEGNESWEALTSAQVRRLDEAGQELIIWAAVMGREFHIEILSRAMELSETEILSRVERLEKRGLLKPNSDGRYDFAHDLVREVVQRGLSQARRRTIHRRIANVLITSVNSDTSLYGDLVHHASAASENIVAINACRGAAEHCLRAFANSQATTAVERGLAMLERLPAGADRAAAHIDLLRLGIVAAGGPGTRPLPEVMSELKRAAQTAEWMGLNAAAASAYHILSWLTQQANDTERTRKATLDAERLSRAADGGTRCQQLANSGRCLLEVERDLPRARSLIDEAGREADLLRLHLIELEWGRALLRRWEGDLGAAQSLLETAIELARVREDRWREFECLVWLATIKLERGQYQSVDLLSGDIAKAAVLMGDIRAPIGNALRALAVLSTPEEAGRDEAISLLETSVEELRALDDKAHLAYVLNQSARWYLDRNRLDRAEANAREALAAAEAVDRMTEIEVARSILCCVDCAFGRSAEVESYVGPHRLSEGTEHSARAMEFINLAKRAVSHRTTAKT